MTIKPGQVLNPRGAKRKEITAVGLRAVTKYASKGVHEYTLAHLLNMDPDTFAARKKDTPKLVAAIQRGRALWHDRCVARLDKHAEKSFIPDMFTLKSKFGWREGDPEGEHRPTIVINLPTAMPLKTFLTVEPDPAPKLLERKRG